MSAPTASRESSPAPWLLHPYFAALVSIIGALASTRILAGITLSPTWRLAVVGLAVGPSVFLMYAMYRWVGRMDEMQRRIHAEALALAFTGAMLAGLTLEFLQKAGFAAGVGWSRAWEGMGILYVISLLFVCRRYA